MRAILTAGAVCGLSAGAVGEIVNFDDLTLGTQYMVGDSFMSGADTFDIMDFEPGYLFSNFAQVDDATDATNAGGSGLNMELNNVRLELRMPYSSLPSLTIFFGQYGGEQHLFVNGTQLTTGNFYTLDGMTIGGADIEVFDLGGGPTHGRLTVSGDITSFGISGQELWVDDLRYVAPSPGAGALMAVGMLGMVARRRGT